MTTTIDITKPCTTRDGRPVRNLVRYRGYGTTITGIVDCGNGKEFIGTWHDDGKECPGKNGNADLIQAPEVVEVTVYYYRINGRVCAFNEPHPECRLFAKETRRVTEGEGL